MKKTTTIFAVLLVAALLLSACGQAGNQSTATPDVLNNPGSSSNQVTSQPLATQSLPTANTTQSETLSTPSASGTATGSQAQGNNGQAPVPVTSGGAVIELQNTFSQIYQQVNPSVVNIHTVIQSAGSLNLPPGHPALPGDQGTAQALGSGFVWDNQGHIVTNNHVVEGATQIQVSFVDGTTVPADVVATAPGADLAVLKVSVSDPSILKPVVMGDSSQLQVGQFVAAIGYPYGLAGTMTTGIISALGRNLPASTDTATSTTAATFTIPDIIQTDAPINPGNSGGVLVAIDGEVIGVNTAIQSPVEGSVGLGFSIPSNIVKQVVPALIQNGKFDFPYLGVSGMSLNSAIRQQMNLNANQNGFLVIEVAPGSPAEKAGLRGSQQQATVDGQQLLVGGDIITAINGQQLNNFDRLNSFLVENTKVGDQITLTVLRDGQQSDVQATLAARPSSDNLSLGGGQTNPGQTLPSPSTGAAYVGFTGIPMDTELSQAMNLSQPVQGILVEQVQQGSPADQAGLQAGTQPYQYQGQTVMIGGDIIFDVAGTQITSMQDLQAVLAQANPGDQLMFMIIRNGQLFELPVTLGERPSGG